MKISRLFPVMLALVFASGCAPRFYVGVDSISSDDALRKRTYVLLPGNKDTSSEDLRFNEFAAYVHQALGSQGFNPAPGIEQADIAIVLAYGIGDPDKHQYTYAIPMWGRTGVSSSTTHGTFNTYGGFGTYSGTATYTPTYGITGYSTGSSGDLRRVVPALVAASSQYLGKNTGRRMEIVIGEDSPAVTQIKGTESVKPLR